MTEAQSRSGHASGPASGQSNGHDSGQSGGHPGDGGATSAEPAAEWSIQQVARLTGVTSRTLRHYGDIGLLPAGRTAANGYRYYGAAELRRLQRILMLRELGLGLAAIGGILDGQRDDTRALGIHLRWLRAEKDRLDRQIGSVESTITALEGGEQMMAENMFDGFDHTRYREEVEQRWGADAYTSGDRWWVSKSEAEKAEWMLRQQQLSADWVDAAARGIPADGGEAQQLAERHVRWLAGIPGVPRDTNGVLEKDYLVGLGELYVSDERFAANYGGAAGATFVRDALRVYSDRQQ